MTDTRAGSRLITLDQFRGYAIFSMILVNFLGIFDAMPEMLKHHGTGFSYADLVAPVFMFVVGMGFRLSLPRAIARQGLWPARRRALRRYAIIIFLGLCYGGFDLRVSVWDALLDIGCAGILALLFIERGPLVRAAAACAYLALYQALFSWAGYGGWVMHNSIDGGPLGPLSWVFILLMGTLAYDLLATADTRAVVKGCLAWGLALCIAGWALRWPWPGIKAEWVFTQRGMSAPYPVYAAGLSFLILLAFYLFCDVLNWRFPHLSTLGENPLVIYLFQAVLCIVLEQIIPSNTPPWLALAEFAAVYGLCYGLAWGLHRKRIIVKI